ncbi:MAG: hypothetical protein LAQ69_07930 [Acidobacteriia bacterium]|nr:hypothetical protein [Terriglobia bacterium]
MRSHSISKGLLASTAALALITACAEVKSIINTLWPGGTAAAVGKGRVFAADSAAAALQAIRLAPDFTYVKPNVDSRVMFIHRRLSNGDAYFLSNRVDRSETIDASFRVSGRKAELWDPAAGRTRRRDALPGGFSAAGIGADRPRQNRPRGSSELEEQEHEFIVRS